jgi:hypothetical protein
LLGHSGHRGGRHCGLSLQQLAAIHRACGHGDSLKPQVRRRWPGKPWSRTTREADRKSRWPSRQLRLDLFPPERRSACRSDLDRGSRCPAPEWHPNQIEMLRPGAAVRLTISTWAENQAVTGLSGSRPRMKARRDAGMWSQSYFERYRTTVVSLADEQPGDHLVDPHRAIASDH